MKIESLIVVGENIHCTRIFKTNGKNVAADDAGGFAIVYGGRDAQRRLPIPEPFVRGADWGAGKVKHCAVAVWHGLNGDAAGKAAGADYIRHLACEQERNGATYLDINVDEYSTDPDERIRAMRWAVGVAQAATRLPMSIDSSNEDVLEAGLQSCEAARGRPMVNSVSLERIQAVETAARFRAVVIASAAGEKELPNSTEERMANIARLMRILEDAKFERKAVHVDPLVFPISVDGLNGARFLECVAAVRKQYGPDVHIVAGLSNVSFGMPARKLINQVFTRLAVEHGADGGIVDPAQINVSALNRLDPESEGFRLAKALLLGEDEYGMEFIAAAREGKI